MLWTDTTKCVARIANKVNLSERPKHRAIDLMNDVVKSGLSAGKDPMALAAIVVYASCVRTGERKSQIDIANVTELTVCVFLIKPCLSTFTR
jgi:transcription initiation factor TFIIB